MASRIQDVMTEDPTTVPAGASLAEAARVMRDGDIGDVLVVDGRQLRGILTDRDLVVRGLAEGRDPDRAVVGDLCSTDVVTVSPEDDTESAAVLMRDNAVRRLPVVVEGEPVGIVSLGDLALRDDPESALADISDATPSR
jgi:CBS domain-containing protein